jgi:8-oxo-dGTP diphosphatase
MTQLREVVFERGDICMQGYNVLMIFDKNMERMLMCKRSKNLYKGLFNMTGGKIDSGESGLEAAYRDVEPAGDENELFWADLNENFFDITGYGGDGNIGHMLEQAKQCKELQWDEVQLV